MFEKLTVKNYLLLKNIEIDFASGFNIITGETGAGKSILINALSLLMGERADYSIIGKNKEKMIIEGLLNISTANKPIIERIFKENNIDSLGDNLIIRRELYSKAYSRNFVNDCPASTSVLSELSNIMIDIHSQNEHQSLLKKEIHSELLDSYLCKSGDKKIAEKINGYKQEYTDLLSITVEYEKIRNKKTELENKHSFIEFQLKEINDVNPGPGEDDELEKELKISENSEEIQKALNLAYASLYEDSGSVVERLKIIEKELSKISQYNSDAERILNDISQSFTVLSESGRSLQELLGNLSFDPEEIEKIRERLYKLQFIKKKYGGTLDEALRLKAELEGERSLAENFDEKVKEFEEKIKSTRESLLKQAKDISKIRKEKCKPLEAEVTGVFKEIGFENAGFKVDILQTEDFSKNGIDDVEFLVKTNKGEEYSSLRKTASGGEVSRIMLALKSVLAGADNVDILVFDEIDAGISGRIAQKVGKVMKSLSEHHQIIAITHLAQIAALADEHLLVEKETEAGATITKIRKLDKAEKVIEVAKLLSGEKITDAAIKSAKELMAG